MKTRLFRRLAAAMLCTGLATAAHAQALQKLVLFGQPSVNNDAVWMALDNGYYKAEGIDLEYRPFPSGMTAFQSFKAGQGRHHHDRRPAGRAVLPGRPQRLQNHRRDRAGCEGLRRRRRQGVHQAAGPGGKTVATRVGSTGSWFISEYLSKNGVDPASVTVKNLDTQLLPTAVCGGSIAAFFIWQPVGSRALEICPDKVHYLTDATGYIQGYLLAGARPQWLATPKGHDLAIRFLRATMRGRDKAQSDFAAVAAYAAAHLSLSEAATRAQWDTNIRPLALDNVFYQDFLQREPVGARQQGDRPSARLHRLHLAGGACGRSTRSWP